MRGIIIKLDKPIVQLLDFHIYLLNSVPKSLETEYYNAVNKYNKSHKTNYVLNKLYSNLSINSLEENVSFADYDMITPIMSYEKGVFIYYLTKTIQTNIPLIISDIINISNELTRESRQNVLYNFINGGENYFKLFGFDREIEDDYEESSTDDYEENDNYEESLTDDFFNGIISKLPLLAYGPSLDFETKKIILNKYYKKKEIVENMFEILQKSKRDKNQKDDKDLKDYIRSLDPDIILEAMKNMTPAQQKKYINNINPQTYAENSNIRFEICKPEEKVNVSISKNKKNKNDGIYQLFLVKNNRTEHVHFKRKTAFIVFLIYLADRLLKGVETTYIDLESKNIEKEFITMYDVIYPNEKNAKEKYDNLTKIKSDGKNKKQRISDCYSYITEVIAESFEKLDENVVSPFVIGSQSEHIHTKQEMISIPVEILKIADDLASKSQTTSWLKKALKFIKN